MMVDQDKKQHVPYYRKPEELTLEEWQKALREQFAAGKMFKLKRTSGISLSIQITKCIILKQNKPTRSPSGIT